MKDIMNGIFPVPICVVKRDLNLSPKEEKDIEDIVKEGMESNVGNFKTPNSYIFDSKLKKIKQFCEQQLKIYVEQIISPEEELDFYITQSWLNITKPGGFHHDHHHPNSIISGVFYVSTEEDDKIILCDPNFKIKEMILIKQKEFNVWNSPTWFFPSVINELVLFPSWLSHHVDVNENAITDRISISFNTFAKGIFGNRNEKTELILQ